MAPGAAASGRAGHVFHPQPLELNKPGRGRLDDLEQAAPVVGDRQFVDIGVQNAPGPRKAAPPRMLERHALAGNRIGLAQRYWLAHVKCAIGKRPANDRDPIEARNLGQRFGDVALRIAVRTVIVKQYTVAAMDLGIEAGPVLNPLQVVVPAERRYDAAALELLFQVGLDRQDGPPHRAFDRQPLRAGRSRDPGLRQHDSVANLMGARFARRQRDEFLL